MVEGVTGESPVPTGVWTHLSVTYDGAALRLFVNGVQADAVSVTGTLPNGQPLMIGGTRGSAMTFNGTIDDVRIYRRALSVEEIATDMQTPADQPSGPPPTLLSISIDPVGASISTGSTQQYYATGTYDNGTTDDVTLEATWTTSEPNVASVDGGAATGTGPGLATLTATVGTISDSSEIQVADGPPLPDMPSWVAPPLNPAESTTVATATAFLYSGTNPIQTGVAAGTISARQAAVLRGAAKDRNGDAIPGVVVTIDDHPELGSTRTRADGAFDMAVNAGGSLVVRYNKEGLLPLDRRVTVPAGDYFAVDDVVMIAQDPLVTAVNLASSVPIQVAQSSISTDASGSRRATIMFPQGTTAIMQLPGGGTQPLTTMHVRATEYTVGPTGPAAMPGSLPPASAYTHAVELSVDEAVAAGATSVTFNGPIPVYYENFLGFPVGASVPTGYYDRERNTWVPSENGVVLEILSIDGSGRAVLDLDGDDEPDDAATLAAFGITDAERSTLATTYSVAQSLWRVAVSHFTAFDENWPRDVPPDANQNPDPGQPRGNDKSKEPCEQPGSIIECQDQILGERLALTGTPYSLNYRSDRMPGYAASDSMTIPLTEATVPASMIRVDLTVWIAGQVFRQSFAPTPNLTTEFTWNHRDAYGRTVYGARPAQIIVDHVYPFYYVPPYYAQRPFQFGRYNVTEVAPNMFLVPSPRTWSVPIHMSIELGQPPPAAQSVGGWSISPHHVYDPASRTVLFGDGGKRKVDPKVAGPPVERLNVPEFQYLNAVVSEAGMFYVNDDQVFRQNGIDPPTQIASLPNGWSIAVDSAGVLYYPHCISAGLIGVSRIVSGSPQLVGSAAMPGGSSCSIAMFLYIVRSPDGTLYVSSDNSSFHGLFQLTPDGALEFVTQFEDYTENLAVGADGTLYRGAYITATDGMVIERLSDSGDVVRVAGNGFYGGAGDGGRAIDADLGYIYDFAVAADGSLLLVDWGPQSIRLRRVGPDGSIRTIAGGVRGTDTRLHLPNRSPSTAITYIQHVDVGPDGWIYVFGHHGYRFAPDFDPSQTMTIASEDGSEVYEFTPAGRHLRTINTMTGANMQTFGYDSAGRLTSITNGDGLVTEVHRNGAGLPTAIEAPFGQTTTLTTTSDGWLSTIVAPGGRSTSMTPSSAGLLTTLRDARNQLHTFTFDTDGRLVLDENPAGGSLALGRSTTGSGWTTTETTAIGRVTTYATTTLVTNGAQQLTRIAPDGTSTVVISHEDGSREQTAANGTHFITTADADPRLGLQAPIPLSSIVTTPGGLTQSTVYARVVDDFDPLDYSTLVQHDYVTINGREYETIFDGATRTFTTTSPAGRVTTSTIDAQGRVTSSQVGSLTPVQFGYDAQGRLTSIAQGVRQSTGAYDTSGRLSVLTDALTRTVTFSYDMAGRVAAQTLPNSQVIGFGYDANNNITSLTPPGRPAHSFAHTPVNLTSSYTPPSVAGSGPTGYVFNLDRQPTAVQRPDGQTTSFTYEEPSGRLTGATFSRGTLAYGYDTAGRINSLADPGGVNLAFTYDGSLPLSETWSGPLAGSVSRTFSNHFDFATESVNGAHTVAFGYDDDRLLTSAGALTIARDATNGLVTGTTLGSTTETHQYNAFGEPSRQTSTFNTTQLFDVQTTRDNLGRVTQRIETFPEITRTFHYAYDLAGRLESVSRDGVSGAVTVAAYTYDSNGNRLTAQGEAYGGGAPMAATYDTQDRLLTYGATSYTYTANGELATKTISGQTTSYIYDTLGNLLSVTKPNADVISYTIDGRGRRVGKSINGTLVKGWLYADQLRPIAELDGSGSLVSRFVYGSKPNVPEYVIKNGTTYRIISDHLGSPRVIVEVATGAVVQRMDFHAFGEIVQDSNPSWQPFGFAGGLYDPDTDLIRLGARDFDPISGHFTSKDPSGFFGGVPSLYEYAGGDPLNSIDPEGMGSIKATTDPYAQAVSALESFRNNYNKMRDANTIGADKYFHCKANCEAARRGAVGRSVARAASFGREWFDSIKGDSIAACAADMTANAQGRDSDPTVPCAKACGSLRPPGLPSRY